MDSIKYRSLEEYADSRRPGVTFSDPTVGDPYKGDRTYATTEINQLKNICNMLFININLFKPSTETRFLITEDVAGLFTFLLDYYYKRQKGNIKLGRFDLIPEEKLLDLRNKLLYALNSIDIEFAVVEKELKLFERKTGCPPSLSYCPKSVLTLDAIYYLRADNEYDLSDAEWETLKNMLEYDYLYHFRSKFIAHAQKIIEEIRAIRPTKEGTDTTQNAVQNGSIDKVDLQKMGSPETLARSTVIEEMRTFLTGGEPCQ